MAKHAPRYDIGARVQSRIAPSKNGIVTAIVLRESGVVQYIVCWSDSLTDGTFHDFELEEFSPTEPAGFAASK